MSEPNDLTPQPAQDGGAATEPAPDAPATDAALARSDDHERDSEPDPGDEPEGVDALLPYPVVGIGASAGGVEAYIELVSNLPADTGLAFVLVPHLNPNHESHLPQILARRTPMPVSEIQSGTRPAPNEIYVLPPKFRATIERGVFHLDARPPNERVPMPIDRFFRSLAADQRNRAIGVILSGADSDGALGLKAIKGEGGIAIVQDPESARFGDMPRSGMLADHVDLVLPPAEIGAELSRLARQFYQPSLQLLEEGNLSPGDEPQFARILALLRTVGGIDFRHYKPGTVRRRTARRMVLRRVESLAEYARLLVESREELRNLHEDVLINVTRFFRDPSVFDALKTEVLPGIFDKRSPDQQVRIWVAGCSAGEEAYSIAICLLEYLAGQPFEPAIQIFGTDASERSIDKARAALYPLSLASEISPERLRRFFVKTDKGYQVSKWVRDLCIFARQNLCNDPPFSRLDLVSCRNVLIYLKPELQRNVLTTFHYAMRPSACLLLGRSESVPETMGLFSAIDRRHKFYSKLGDSSPVFARMTMPDPKTSAPALTMGRLAMESEPQRAADRIVLARHGPPGVIINQDQDIVEVRGHPAPFLAIAPGAPSLHLLRMAHGDIMPVLRDAIRRASDTGVATTEEVSVHRDGAVHEATLEVLPIQLSASQPQHYLVLFVRKPARASAEAVERVTPEGNTGDRVEDPNRELGRLRRDLTTTRQYLQSLIEERDARNQELTAAYEEIQSANEELQSTNEELETAKEELQSTNEELQTVNDELRNRNQALMQASNDLSNLLNSVNVPVIMMASDLTIRQFTPPAERLMRLRASDIGRPIGEIRSNLMLDDIEPLLHEVLESLATKEVEVQDRTGRWHLLRVRPYRTAENKIEGVVLLLLDIDQLRRGQDEVQQARDFARAVIEGVQAPVVVLGGELRVRTANAAFRGLSALSAADLDGRSFSELVSMLWDWPDLRESLEPLLDPANTATLEVEHESTRLSRHFRLIARGVLADGDPLVLIVMQDVTAQRRAERLLESERERLAGQFRSTAEELHRTREELRALAGRLFTSQEEERKRVARELHDDIGQRLAALEIDIERLRGDLPPAPEDVQSALTGLRVRMSDLSNAVRKLSHQLHPSNLEHLGLAAALKSLVEEFGNRRGMVADFRRSRVPDGIPQEVAAALYRVAQEALRNVAKHAGRTHVKVSLEGSAGRLRLTVRDLGEGFDVTGVARRGLGLVSMEERVRLVGGKFAVESALGEGTKVTVTIPLGGESDH